MATQWQTFPIEFKGGLISNLSLLQQGTNAVGSATILQNFEATREGGYSKIKGYNKYSDTVVAGSGPILGLAVVESDHVVVARENASNVTEYYYGAGDAWTSLGARPLLGNKVRNVIGNLDGTEKLIFVDGVNYPAIYNTSTNAFTAVTGLVDVLGAEHTEFFSDTAWYAKGNTLYFTAPFTLDDFSSANGSGVFNITENITGLVVFRNQLIIFTANSIKRLTGTTSADFTLSSITDRIGCINGDTIKEVGGDIMYLAPDGIRLLSATDRIGDFALDIASDPITKDANTFLSSTSTFTSVLIREKAQYRIFAYIPSEQNEVAKGLIATKFIAQGAAGISWSTTFGIKAYVADSRYSGSEETIVFANADGYVYVMDTGSSFDGSVIEAIYESPYMPITDPQMRKSFYKMTLYAEPKGDMDIAFNVKYDFDESGSTTTIQPPSQDVSITSGGVFAFGSSRSVFGNVISAPNVPQVSDPGDAARFGGNISKVYPNNIIGSGKTISIRVADRSINPTFTLDAALLEYSQNDRQ